MAGLGLNLTASRLPDPAFWNGRRVLLTGHSGFKGAWAFTWLQRLGSEVVGVSLAPSTEPSLAKLLSIPDAPSSFLADMRDPAALSAAVGSFEPEVVIHMAARALLPEALREPVETFSVNVIGTANMLELSRSFPSLRCMLTVTSDKVYKIHGTARAFTEDDPLGGHDPYSASKAAQEMVVAAWRSSYFSAAGVRLLTARGGNVVGGGDWSADRLLPDTVRALAAGTPVALRDAKGVRPWQHVLDVLNGYLCFVESAMGHVEVAPEVPDALNFGPETTFESLSVGQLVERFHNYFGAPTIDTISATSIPIENPHLRLNIDAAKNCLGWRPRLDVDTTIAWTAAWYRDHAAGQSADALVEAQLEAFKQA